MCSRLNVAPAHSLFARRFAFLRNFFVLTQIVCHFAIVPAHFLVLVAQRSVLDEAYCDDVLSFRPDFKHKRMARRQNGDYLLASGAEEEMCEAKGKSCEEN